MIKKKFPQNWVRHYRNIAGLSAQTLGDEIGMSKEGVTYIERRERALTIEKAKKIGAALDVHYIKLIDGPEGGELDPRTEQERQSLEIFRSLPESEQENSCK